MGNAAGDSSFAVSFANFMSAAIELAPELDAALRTQLREGEVVAYARARGLERLLAFGAASRASVEALGDGAEHFGSIEAVCARACELAGAGSTVLVKGSRSMQMERVVHALAGAAANVGGHH